MRSNRTKKQRNAKLLDNSTLHTCCMASYSTHAGKVLEIEHLILLPSFPSDIPHKLL